MMSILGPLLASMIIAQADRPRTGEVVDGQGKPVADAGCPLLRSPRGLRQGRSGRGANQDRRRRQVQPESSAAQTNCRQRR